ncbi:putative disease resistance protein RGA4 [Prosopis cineraria]|uniref:putative disease resistance protein RGA4 n=1 Tax=Prosopis cineraria TaxID=364024 RepID=UPI00240FBE7F|nr:putative disease resistance protein RGA4 [Prosopis cineraria]
MDAIASKIIDLLSSPFAEDFKLIWNFKDDLESMKITVASIKDVLRDAEGKATNLQVTNWLVKVKDVFLDADDLFDDLSAEALRIEIMTQRRKAKEVRVFFSKSNRVAYYLKMSHAFKGIMKRLDHLAKVKNDFKFNDSAPDVPVLYRERETYSFVPEHEVIGREEERNCIINYLLDSNVTDNVSVVSVFGIGGMGKTALAQLVFNDKAVQNYFEPKMWVSVCDESVFDVNQMAQKILGRQTGQVEHDLSDKIGGKRFLLVLDDVWNEDSALWIKLKHLLMGGSNGSMIIVTTRSEKVARIMGTHLSISLQGLDEQKSWELFSCVAFGNGEEPNGELVEIGKVIVKKCSGVPLAIKTVGSLLYSRNLGERDWIYFKDSELSKIAQEENKIFEILRLSYDHLPSYLKNCFAYCSLFPKDFVFERKTLIQLWVAQGFIQSFDRSRSVEDVGHEYFMMLLSRCFFQDVKVNEYGDVWTCKMHDLIHDLAMLVAENEYIVISEGKDGNYGDGVRHVSFDKNKSFLWKVPTSMLKANKLRTLLSPNGFIQITLSHLPPLLRLRKLFGGSATSFPKRLRVLDLHYSFIRAVPEIIGKLKHLRYLDLSNNNFEELPLCITELYNLQTLKLNCCFKLKELPGDISKMVSLKHLELMGCNSLLYMPCGLGQLTHMQTLTKFVSDDRMRNSARISELSRLNSLRGKLIITSLQAQRGNTTEVESTKLLAEKQYIQELELIWLPESEESEREAGYKDEIILDALQPHPKIKRLSLDRYCGNTLPRWIGNLTWLLKLHIYWGKCFASLPMENLTSLRELTITNCLSLVSLPESMGNLTSLKKLVIRDCSSLASLPMSLGNLTSLRVLKITKCYALESLSKLIWNLTSLWKLQIDNNTCLVSLLESVKSPPSLSEIQFIDCSLFASQAEPIRSVSPLKKLEISNCSALTSLPDSIWNLTSLRELKITSCFDLALLPESIGNLTSLRVLEIKNCSALASLPESIGNLTSLWELEITYCYALASLPESIGYLTSLRKFEITNCSALASLPESIVNFTLLPKLEVKNCFALASLPESIGNLSSLQKLEIANSFNLASLPESIGNLSSLRQLEVTNCHALASLPELMNLTSLLKLGIIGCQASLLESIGNLTSLMVLGIECCSNLTSLPESIGNLISLRELRIHDCLTLTSLPESIRNLVSLQELEISCCSALASLPNSIGNLTSLQKLGIRNCFALASVPESIGNITSLQKLGIVGSYALDSLPESIGNLASLCMLEIGECICLESLPESMGNLTSLLELEIKYCSALTSLPDSIGNLTSLLKLEIKYCFTLASLPDSIENMTSLQKLIITDCCNLKPYLNQKNLPFLEVGRP